jgi:hypothetical protein
LSASAAVILFFGSNTSIFSNKSIATSCYAFTSDKGSGCSLPSGSAFLKRSENGTLFLLGKDSTNFKVYMHITNGTRVL